MKPAIPLRALAGLAMLALALPVAAAEPARTGHEGLFGYLEFASPRLDALPAWRDALARIAEDASRVGACDADVSACASVPMTVWRAKVEELVSLDARERLIEANRYVNALPGRKEPAAFAATDRWASPLEVLERGGDAKDLAVMKFVTLRDAGVANDAMRIVVVYDALRHRRHVVLAVTLSEGTFILDTVSDLVQPAEKVRYYVPYYSVNETTRWAHVVHRAGRADG